jgi:hypothetical protein
MMKKNMCLLERISKVGIGSFFLLMAIGLMLSGLTVFPIFGFLFAFPVLLVSIYFFGAHLNQSCQIEGE